MNRYGGKGGFALGLAICWFGVVSSATATPSDVSRAGSIIKRVFSYDRHLRDSERVVVLVVASDRESPELNDVVSALRTNGLYPAVVAPTELASKDLTATLTPESTVVYVADTADVETVKAFAAEKGFLTVSVQPFLAEAGDVSVSVAMEDGQPQIVVNLPRLRVEGHEISSELLNLARVIR